MIIRVTREDIKRGKKSYLDCPLSLAITRQTGLEAFVSTSGVYVSTFPGFRVEHPRSAKRFIARYDSAKPVKPFNFILKGF